MDLVLHDRPAQRRADLLVRIRQHLLRHQVRGVQRVAAEVAVGAAGEVVRARLGDRLDFHAGRSPLRDVEHVGDDLELGDRFAAELRLTEPGAGHLLRDLLAVEIELPQIVHRAGADAVADVVGGHALDQLGQLHPVASLERQLFHLSPIDVAGHLRGGGVDERRLTDDGQRLGHRGELEGERDRRVLSDQQLDVLELDRRKPGELGLHGVFARRHVLQPVFTFFVGHTHDLAACGLIGGGDVDSGQHGFRFVHRGTDDGGLLRERSGADERHKCDEDHDAQPTHRATLLRG